MFEISLLDAALLQTGFMLLGDLAEKLTGARRLELDTFIPSALFIDFSIDFCLISARDMHRKEKA